MNTAMIEPHLFGKTIERSGGGMLGEIGSAVARVYIFVPFRIPVNKEEITIFLIFFVMIDLGSFAGELLWTIVLDGDDGKYDFPVVQA